jgi:steroid delta-isomerase-like uncharacterized protein
MPGSTEDANIAIVHRFVDAENRHDIDTIAGLMGDTCDYYGNGTLVASSWDEYRPLMAATFAAFPDSHREVLQIAAQNDLVAFRWKVTGTHRGPYRGIPASGKSVLFNGTSWIRVADGRITAAWFDMDLAEPVRQMTAG